MARWESSGLFEKMPHSCMRRQAVLWKDLYRLFCGLDGEVAQLAGIDGGGGACHQLNAAIVFGECDDVANAFGSGEEHDEAVETKGDTAVGRSAQAERFKEVPEHRLLRLGIDAEDGEHLRLKIGLVDAEAAAADFNAVEHHVVGDGADFGEGTCFEFIKVFSARTCERVVHGVPFLLLGIPCEQRKIDHPEEV